MTFDVTKDPAYQKRLQQRLEEHRRLRRSKEECLQELAEAWAMTKAKHGVPVAPARRRSA